jgi:hypothetical protein
MDRAAARSGRRATSSAGWPGMSSIICGRSRTGSSELRQPGRNTKHPPRGNINQPQPEPNLRLNRVERGAAQRGDLRRRCAALATRYAGASFDAGLNRSKFVKTAHR